MKKTFILSLLILGLVHNPALSQDESVECIPSDAIEKFSADVLAFTAPLKECPTDDELILKLVNQEYANNFGNLAQISKNVKGHLLKGSARELELAERMLGAKPPKGWSAAAKACSTIQCAFEKLLKSQEAAKQIFNFASKTGYVLSLDQTVNQGKADQIWSAKEIRELDAGASKMPKQLKSLPYLKSIERMADGYRRSMHSQGVAAFASPAITDIKKAELVMYDSALGGTISKGSPYDQASWPQEVLIHEICHHHDFKGYYATDYGTMTTEQKGSSFAALSGWKEKTGKNGGTSWVHSEKAQFVSSYASTQPAEDYAETCANYVLHPEVLLKKAPAKYAYMKNKIFEGREFKDKPWSKPKDVSWPKLNDLIASDEGCVSHLVECSKGITFSYGLFSSPDFSSSSTNGSTSSTIWSYSSAENIVKNNECFKKFKNERAKAIEEELSKAEEYCDKGGQSVIKSASARLCTNTENQLISALEAAAKVDMGPSIKDCEANKDYTTECVLSKASLNLNAPEAMIPAVERILASKVPKRMSALGENLNALGTTKWLKPCLDSVSEMRIIRATQGDTFLSYDSVDKNYAGAYDLGRNLYEDRQTKDLNMKCAEKVVDLFKEAGFKTPASENPINVIKKNFADEMTSFETDVLIKIKESTQKCLLKKCKREKVTELLEAWQLKEPSKRAGIVDERFVEELIGKTASY
jgi:hypothetical protein